MERPLSGSIGISSSIFSTGTDFKSLTSGDMEALSFNIEGSSLSAFSAVRDLSLWPSGDAACSLSGVREKSCTSSF